MSLLSLRTKLIAIVVSVMVCACGGGGSAAPPPSTGITVTPGNNQVTVTWQAEPGVEYWLLYAPGTSISIDNPPARHAWATNISSPYVIPGLANGVPYVFTMNGRKGGGPGGPGTPAVSVIPRMAGGVWTARSGFGNTDVRGLAFGFLSDLTNFAFAAVGKGGAIFASSDGATWRSINFPPKVDLNSVVAAPTGFLAVGAGGSMYFSTDVDNWTAKDAKTTNTLNAVANSGTQVVAVGDNGTIRTSTDGLTWNVATTVPTTEHLYAVNYSPLDGWYAAGANGTMITSLDGDIWVAVNTGTKATLRAIGNQAVLGYTIVAAGDGGTLLTSNDGTTWTAQNLGSSFNLLAISPSVSQFVVVGSSGAIFTSPDGVVWSRQESRTSQTLQALLGTPSYYYALGQNGISLTSE